MKENHKQIAEEILRMARRDQGLRSDPEKNRLSIEEIDKANTARMKEIIEEIGYPTISKVGEGSSQAAWLLVQHATEDLPFMKECLELMKANRDDINSENIAYLEDRVLTLEGQPQLYGTQFTKGSKGGDWEPLPIADLDGVDERRRAAGLKRTLASEYEYLKTL